MSSLEVHGLHLEQTGIPRNIRPILALSPLPTPHWRESNRNRPFTGGASKLCWRSYALFQAFPPYVTTLKLSFTTSVGQVQSTLRGSPSTPTPAVDLEAAAALPNTSTLRGANVSSLLLYSRSHPKSFLRSAHLLQLASVSSAP